MVYNGLESCSVEAIRLHVSDLPPTMRPPMPLILFKRAEPPALIFASRRSLRRRACSAALEAAASLSVATPSVIAEFVDYQCGHHKNTKAWYVVEWKLA